MNLDDLSITHLYDCIQEAKQNPRIRKGMLVNVWSNAFDRPYIGIGLVKAIYWYDEELSWYGVVHMAASGLELEVNACNLEKTYQRNLRLVYSRI